MNTEKNSARKAKAHTIYKTSRGRVPGVTTITGVLNKPALVPWANKLGLQGIEVGKYVDDLADIGTLAHYMIECHINSKIQKEDVKPDLSDYSANQISSAETSFLKFLDWEKKNEVSYIASEMKLVSEKHQFGGQIDIYAEVNGKKTLIDIKTCKAIFSDHFHQVGGGYNILLKENGYPVEDVRIVRVGRSEEEGHEAEDRQVPLLDTFQELFLLCRKIYELNKTIKDNYGATISD